MVRTFSRSKLVMINGRKGRRIAGIAMSRITYLVTAAAPLRLGHEPTLIARQASRARPSQSFLRKAPVFWYYCDARRFPAARHLFCPERTLDISNSKKILR